MRAHTEERLNREWKELYERMKLILQQYGEDSINGGDYFVIDESFEDYVHQVEMHKLHMLQPDVIKTLQSVLANYPDWEIEISVSIRTSKIRIGPGKGLTLRDGAIIDGLDRKRLPKEYRSLVYEGSRPRRRFGAGIFAND